MRLAFLTHRGAVRPENQDALQMGERTYLGDVGPGTAEVDGYPLLLAVVDGMGGTHGGRDAAGILAKTLAEGASCFSTDFVPDKDIELIEGLLRKAHIGMKKHAFENPGCAKMGAVVAGAIVRERSVLVFNCGDCRVYRMSGGELEKLTRDHSVVQVLFEGKEITEDGMRTHPRKNIVTSAVTAENEVFEVYAKGASRSEGDSFFICSDGVWEALHVTEMEHCLDETEDAAPHKLFDLLLAKDCSDNISFIWGGSDS